MMTLSTNRLSLASAALIAASLLLSACHDESVQHDSALATPSQQASSWDTLPQSDALRAAEETYRACAREAAQLHLAVAEFPEVSDRVSYLTQDGQRVRKTEQVKVNIDDMHIDNGCATRIVKSVSIDVVYGETQAAIVDETGRTHSPRRNTPAAAGAAHVQLAVAKKPQAAAGCTPTRDPGPQSHFMMLNLCWSEERRAGQEEHPEESLTRPKKNATPATSS